MNTRPHLQHYRTKYLEYKEIEYKYIPKNVEIHDKPYKPEPADIEEGSPEYIKVDDVYYRLNGLMPEDLAEGEIAISLKSGHEGLFIKNNNGEFVEFKPYNPDSQSITKYMVGNPAMISNKGVCVWNIQYSELLANNIDKETATISLFEISSGKQIFTGVEFKENSIEISFDSEKNITPFTYKAIII